MIARSPDAIASSRIDQPPCRELSRAERRGTRATGKGEAPESEAIDPVVEKRGDSRRWRRASGAQRGGSNSLSEHHAHLRYTGESAGGRARSRRSNVVHNEPEGDRHDEMSASQHTDQPLTGAREEEAHMSAKDFSEASGSR